MRLLAPAPSAVLVTALLALTSLAAETPPRAAHPVFTDGQAQIVPEFQESADWIQEKLWVETEFDSDATAAGTACSWTSPGSVRPRPRG